MSPSKIAFETVKSPIDYGNSSNSIVIPSLTLGLMDGPVKQHKKCLECSDNAYITTKTTETHLVKY